MQDMEQRFKNIKIEDSNFKFEADRTGKVSLNKNGIIINFEQ